jgi:hypothetical protein
VNSFLTVSSLLESEIKRILFSKFLSEVDTVKKIICDNYDRKLVDYVGTDTRLSPGLYRNKFLSFLDEFNYVNETGNSVTFVTPDMDNLIFPEELELIRSILDGVSGVYVELDVVDYRLIFGYAPNGLTPIGPDSIYLVRYNSEIAATESAIRRIFTRFPFSDTKPIDIFYEASRYIDNNIDKWANDSVETASTNIKGSA